MVNEENTKNLKRTAYITTPRDWEITIMGYSIKVILNK